MVARIIAPGTRPRYGPTSDWYSGLAVYQLGHPVLDLKALLGFVVSHET